MAATSFDASMKFMLLSEGGWSNNPRDPGGATMEGITFATFRAHFPHATLDDLRDITNEQRDDIYRHGYWNAVKADDLPAGVDLSVFDFGVNAGPGRSTRLLQGVVGTPEDGILGPHSLASIAAMPVGSIIHGLAVAQQAYYESLSTFDDFGDGWTRRTNDREAAAIELSGVAMS